LLRPERITLDAAPAEGSNAVAGTVEVVSFLGTSTHCSLRLPSGRLLLAERPASWAELRVPACRPRHDGTRQHWCR
jgi:hypothetical protein